MKIAISVSDATFAKAEALAKQLGTSRSAVFARAVDAFRINDEIDLTEAANRYADEMTDEMREEQEMFMRAGARTVLKHTEW